MTGRASKRAVLIAGPTASGKSALALALAEALGGTVINADSMQVYRELRALTARPDAAAEARVPHRLYGVMSAAERCSVGRWLALARPEIEAAELPIVVGGTGLYFRALSEGLAAVPAGAERPGRGVAPGPAAAPRAGRPPRPVRPGRTR